MRQFFSLFKSSLILLFLGLCSTLLQCLRQHRFDTLAFAAQLFRWLRYVLPSALVVSSQCLWLYPQALGGVDST